jgi:hypothetical protein
MVALPTAVPNPTFPRDAIALGDPTAADPWGAIGGDLTWGG